MGSVFALQCLSVFHVSSYECFSCMSAQAYACVSYIRPVRSDRQLGVSNVSASLLGMGSTLNASHVVADIMIASNPFCDYPSQKTYVQSEVICSGMLQTIQFASIIVPLFSESSYVVAAIMIAIESFL